MRIFRKFFFEILKNVEVWKLFGNFEKKIGNFDQILKFVKKIEIWKRFGNLEKIWKFGKGSEIWKRFGNFEKESIVDIDVKPIIRGGSDYLKYGEG